MIKEACVENFTPIPEVIKKGANRIELCDNLAVGGTTVSYGILKKTMAYCRPLNIPVMVMIRPRGGDFHYTEEEKEIMLQDLEVAKSLQADGVVIGALTADKQLDIPFLEQVIEKGGVTQLVFHMAFDQLPEKEQFRALDWLADNGFDRILTHGGPPEKPLADTVTHIKELVEAAGEHITIMPGGGVTAANCQAVMDYCQVEEAHGTRIV